MKKTKILSFLLAFSLLFHSTGIEALATAATEPIPEEQTVEVLDNVSTEEEEGTETSQQPIEEDKANEESSEEVQNPEQPSDSEQEEQPPVDNEESKEPSEETEAPEIPSEEEEGDMQEPSEGTDAEEPDVDDASGEEPDTDDISSEEPSNSEETVSENSISENSISENSITEEDDFAIFPGLSDNYTLSSAQMENKRILSAHVGDIVSSKSMDAGEYPDAEGIYELGEVVYLAETEEEAMQVADAFGGVLKSYSYGVAVIGLPAKVAVARAIAAAADPATKLPAVWPNYYNYLHSDENAVNAVAGPSDPEFDTQWQHDYIGTNYAWAAGYKGQGVKVAVIDTGLQRNHEDLSANAAAGRNFVDGATGTEYDFDNQTHGSHVAGIIAADDNGIGGVGIAPDAEVRGYCVFPAGENSGAKTSDIMAAIQAAVEDGNDIINMSLGGPMYDYNYETVTQKAYEKGVAIFASSGNDDTDGYNFPAAFSSTISVGAVDQNSAKAAFSNYGSTVKLAFPGVHIYSTVPTGYDYMSGTSQASPAAAGTAAVILSANESIRSKSGKAKVDALLAAMKSSTVKCSGAGMGAGTTWLPSVLKIATDMTAPDAPTIAISETPKSGSIYTAESINATLTTNTAVGVEIWYTTNGKNPTYKNGEVANGEKYIEGVPVTLTGAKKVTIKAIAVNPVTGKVSKVASKVCTLAPIPSGVELISKTGISKVAPGKSLALTATVVPDYAVSKKVQWVVDEKAKAAGITVSNGTVKTKSTTATGTYTVTATAVGADGTSFNGVSDSYTFEVIAKSSIKKIAFMDGTAKLKAQTLNTDETLDLMPYLEVTGLDGNKIENAGADVVWISSNSKVAKVVNGLVTAVGPGKAVIKAVSNDGFNKSASCNVTVTQPVTGIILNGPQKVAVGKAITLKATIVPSNATNKRLTWEVVEGNNVTVSNGKVTAKPGASGTCTVKAKSPDGKVSSDPYTVTIISGKITGIKLSEKNMVLFSKKAASGTPTTGTLQATIEGESGSDKSLITWTSSAPSVADVDDNGNITAKKAGKTVITCASTDGSNKKATCTVNVTVPMSKLVIGTTDSYGDYFEDLGNGVAGYGGYVAQGKSIKMSAKYSSNYGVPSNKKVTWSSSNPDVVSVDKNGKVTADKQAAIGSSAIITATAADGSGVVSNEYLFLVTPLYKKISVDNLYVTAETDEGIPRRPIYYTATVSGGKNPGLSKVYYEPLGTYILGPIPGKVTTDKPSSSQTLSTSDLQKMTVTVKLRDGSGLKAKRTIYAARFKDGKVSYFD